jgi:hypothetical protein
MNTSRQTRDAFYPTLVAGALAIIGLAAFAPAGEAESHGAAMPLMAPPLVAMMGPAAHSPTSTLVVDVDGAALVAMSIANYDR